VTVKEVDEKLKLKETFFLNERYLHILQSILTIVAYEPIVKAKLEGSYSYLIKECEKRLHFKYFINEELLINLGLITAENSLNK
jgi:hypothetical protein